MTQPPYLYQLKLLHFFPGPINPAPPPSSAEKLTTCIAARQFCSENIVCSQVLDLIPKLCGLELGKNTGCRLVRPSVTFFLLKRTEYYKSDFQKKTKKN